MAAYKLEASYRCDQCGKQNTKRAADVRRAIVCGGGLFCDKVCFGLSRRKWLTDEERIADRKERVRLYGIKRREELADQIKKQKADYFKRTYNPKSAKIERAKRMGWHVAYMREYYKDPVKKAEKVAYDRERRDKAKYGEFWECAPILRELEEDIRGRFPTQYERMKARGYYLTKTKGSNRCLTATM